MRQTEVGLWVVYRTEVMKKGPAVNVVCEQAEWDALQLKQSCPHTLIREGIAHEAEAELLARGTSGDTKPRKMVR